MTRLVGADHASFPYSAVVFVQARFPSGAVFTGSGVLVGDNDVLTASHLVHSAGNGGLAEAVQVVPGLDGGSAPFGQITARWANFIPVDADGDGRITRAEGQHDLAVLGLDREPGVVAGQFTLDREADSGPYTVTGYPRTGFDASGPRMIDDQGRARDDAGSGTLTYDGLTVSPGSSGGPVWQQTPEGPEVGGIVSTGSWAADVSESWLMLQAWIAGNDFLTASDPADEWLTGQAGNELFAGGDGDDTVHAGSGADEVYGNPGTDFLRGGPGDDRLFGGQNAGEPRLDARGLLKAQDGTEWLLGGAGDDLIYGNVGGDVLIGGSGRDTLFGGQGADTLAGAAGADRLYGGRGDDSLTGGPGADTIVIAGAGGADTLSGLDAEDTLIFQAGLDGSGIASRDDVCARAVADGQGGTVIDLGAGNSLTITDHPPDWLPGADIELV